LSISHHKRTITTHGFTGVLDDNKLLSDQIKKLYLQHYKKPLSPADMKTITTLVENGGCKGVRLRAKKTASVVPI
jgi:hypothetical protein